MKSFALLFLCACASVAGIESSASAAAPWNSLRSANMKFSQTTPFQLSNPGSKIGLNPQPLPPRTLNQFRWINPGGKIGLNPQPLPPRLFNKF